MKPIFDYTSNRWRYIVSQSKDGGLYRDIGGETFSISDTIALSDYKQPALHNDELATCLDMAIACPSDAYSLFKHMPQEHKPALQAALKTLPPEQYAALMAAAKAANVKKEVAAYA